MWKRKIENVLVDSGHVTCHLKVYMKTDDTFGVGNIDDLGLQQRLLSLFSLSSIPCNVLGVF